MANFRKTRYTVNISLLYFSSKLYDTKLKYTSNILHQSKKIIGLYYSNYAIMGRSYNKTWLLHDYIHFKKIHEVEYI